MRKKGSKPPITGLSDNAEAFYSSLDHTNMSQPNLHFRRKIVRSSILTFFTVLVVAGWLGLRWLHAIGVLDVNQEQLRVITNYKPSDNSVVFDRNGETIGELFSAYYIFIPYKDLPKKLVEAIIAIEDRSFFEHPGIDSRGIVRAIVSRLKGSNSKQGASTITQQVVRHFLLTRERSFERKIKEIFLAIDLETKLSKEKILELYANAMFLGNGAYGVGAAAQRYFGRDLRDLKPHELALIAGLFQSPSRYNPQKFPKRAKQRQISVIKAMYATRAVNRSEAVQMSKEPLEYKIYNPVNLQVAPYFVDYVQELTKDILDKNIKNQGLRIYTTLDINLQEKATAAFANSKPIFERAEKLLLRKRPTADPADVEAAMLVTDPKSGEILAMIGGRDYQKTQFNRAIHALRQPGSLFKPVVYSLALGKEWKWSDVIFVSPVSVDNYRPKNASNAFLTETTLLRAFYLSINTPAVEIGNKLGLRSVIRHAQDLGISTEIRREAGSILGGSEASMLDVTTVYGTFANQGKRVDPVAITKITDRKGKVLYSAKPVVEREHEVLLPQIAYLMMQGMKAVFHFGTAARHAELGKYAAGKTGTSNDSKDNWFCGFTPKLVAAVWVGTDMSDGLYDYATGTSLALPIWADFMNRVIAPKEDYSFPQPPGIVSHKVDAHYGNVDDDGIKMYFLQGKEPERKDSNLKTINKTGGFRAMFD